jgi:hypothetical protein
MMDPRPRKTTLETFNDEMAVLDRPLENDVEYYDEKPPSRWRGVTSVLFGVVVIGAASGLVFVKMRSSNAAQAQAAAPAPAPAAGRDSVGGDCGRAGSRARADPGRRARRRPPRRPTTRRARSRPRRPPPMRRQRARRRGPRGRRSARRRRTPSTRDPGAAARSSTAARRR